LTRHSMHTAALAHACTKHNCVIGHKNPAV
jgi:hypothetical protein